MLELYTEHIGAEAALNRPERLDSAVALPQASMFGVDLYPHVYLKAAVMLRSLVQNQSFLDGNKRIAWLATRVFLAANGVDVYASVDDGLALMIALADGQLDVEAIGAWLAERSAIREDVAEDVS